MWNLEIQADAYLFIVILKGWAHFFPEYNERESEEGGDWLTHIPFDINGI